MATSVLIQEAINSGVITPQAPIGAAAPTGISTIKSYADHVTALIMSAYAWCAASVKGSAVSGKVSTAVTTTSTVGGKIIKAWGLASLIACVWFAIRLNAASAALEAYGTESSASRTISVAWALNSDDCKVVGEWYARGKLDRAFSTAPEAVDRFKEVI